MDKQSFFVPGSMEPEDTPTALSGWTQSLTARISSLMSPWTASKDLASSNNSDTELTRRPTVDLAGSGIYEPKDVEIGEWELELPIRIGTTLDVNFHFEDDALEGTAWGDLVVAGDMGDDQYYYHLRKEVETRPVIDRLEPVKAALASGISDKIRYKVIQEEVIRLVLAFNFPMEIMALHSIQVSSSYSGRIWQDEGWQKRKDAPLAR